ncbi:MAG: hypothetical protein V3S56_06450, partial [Gemmatimonadota bacterium]
YRPRTGDGLDVDMPCVVELKTHQISADDVGEIAVDYRIQVATYRDAVTALAGRTPRVLLHFTHPNVAIEA